MYGCTYIYTMYIYMYIYQRSSILNIYACSSSSSGSALAVIAKILKNAFNKLCDFQSY